MCCWQQYNCVTCRVTTCSVKCGSRTRVSTTSGGDRGTWCSRTRGSTKSGGKRRTWCSRTRVSTTSGGERGTRCSRTRVSTTSGGKRGTSCWRTRVSTTSGGEREPGVLNGQPSNSSSSQSYIATLENRISFIETQNQNLQMRITTLEQTVKHFMDTNLALSLPLVFHNLV